MPFILQGTLDSLTFSGGSGYPYPTTSGSFDLALDSLTINIVSGTSGVLDGSLDSITVNLHGYSSVGSFDLMLDSLTSNFLSGITKGSFDGLLDSVNFVGSGLSGTNGSFDSYLDSLILSLSGGSSTSGSITAYLDTLRFIGHATGSYECIVINLDNFAVTNYTNFDFKDTAFDDNFLMVSSSGLYELSGTDDNGTAISATIEIGTDDLGDIRVKTEPETILGLKSNGGMQVTLSIDDTAYDAQDVATTDSKYTSRRTMTLFRANGRYVGVKITNVDGADFTLDALTIREKVQDRDDQLRAY